MSGLDGWMAGAGWAWPGVIYGGAARAAYWGMAEVDISQGLGVSGRPARLFGPYSHPCHQERAVHPKWWSFTSPLLVWQMLWGSCNDFLHVLVRCPLNLKPVSFLFFFLAVFCPSVGEFTLRPLSDVSTLQVSMSVLGSIWIPRLPLFYPILLFAI